MATTRIKASNKTVVYHRFAASSSGDAPQTDVGTADSAGLHDKIGSTGDFQLLADDSVSISEQNVIAAATDTACPTLASPKLIWIKNSGYVEEAKTTVTSSTVMVALQAGTTAAEAFTSLSPDQSILLTAPFGSGIDNLDDFVVKSSSANVFCEIIAIVD